MKPKIGISVRSLNQDGSDIEDRIAEVNLYNPDNLELMCFAQDLLIKGDLIPERVSNIAKALTTYKGDVTMHGPLTINFLDHKDNLDLYMEMALSYINLGKALEVEGIIFHTGFCETENSSNLSQRYSKQRDFYKTLADKSGLSEIKIYIENIFPFFKGAHTALPIKLTEEIEKINHPFVHGCFDVSHGYIACKAYKENFMPHALEFGKSSKHWHVHDSFGVPDINVKPFTPSEALALGIGDLHLPVGDGDIPWSEIIKSIQPNYQTTFNIELNPSYWAQLGRCVEATQDLVNEAEQYLTGKSDV